MYADVRVKILEEKGKVTRKKIKGTTYIYYQLDGIYNSEKKYSIPKILQRFAGIILYIQFKTQEKESNKSPLIKHKSLVKIGLKVVE